MNRKLVLIDGHSILNRAFYGLPDLTNSLGQHTGAVYGFLNILFKILEEEKPDYLVVAFDVHAKTFRHLLYADYKGTRKSMPEELREQVPLMKEVLRAMHVTIMEREGLEADDILGTLAKKAEAEGMEVSLVSGDRDLLQIATDQIKIRIPKTKQGRTEIEDYYAKDVLAAYQVTPVQFIELKALMGDTADNIPGVPKIGEKTATELMVSFGSIENIYAHLDDISKKSVRETLAANRELADLSKVLATIKLDCDLELDWESARAEGFYTNEAYALFKKLEFKNMLARFEESPKTEDNPFRESFRTAGELEELESVLARACGEGTEVGLQALLEGGDLLAAAVSLSDRETWFYAVKEEAGEFGTDSAGGIAEEQGDTAGDGAAEEKRDALRRQAGAELTGRVTKKAVKEMDGQLSLFGPGSLAENQEPAALSGTSGRGKAQSGTAQGETEESGKTSENGLCKLLRNVSGKLRLATFDIKHEYDLLDQKDTDRYFDTLIGAYLLNPLKSDYEPETIASEHLDLLIPGRVETFGKRSARQGLREEPEKVRDYLCCCAYTARKAAPVLREKLLAAGMDRLMREVEMPLSLVLYDMEKEGVIVKREELKAYGDALTSRIRELEKSIHEKAGQEFNIQSPKQLGEILFEKMGIKGGKKTKTGYSTAADVLEKLAPEHPIVSEILEYRGLTKLKSTYAEGLAGCIGPDGRIHTSFNQTITATGRISSTEPNLQNIPMRTELGRQIRKVFVPREGCVFLDADYSQIELRILAHMSGDQQLIEAYRMDQDIHRITASKVFHTPFEEVTDLQRRNAKAVNFGIVYGISSFGLSQDLSITPKEAAEYIQQYFETYPGIKRFLDGTVEQAKEKGYVTTLFGRRRPVPELSSSNFMQRSFGERVAMNSPIQGTAADIMKIAMIRVWKALRDAGLRTKIILQVHDELVLETWEDEKDRAAKILEENMKAAADLAVTLEVDVHSGDNWYNAK